MIKRTIVALMGLELLLIPSYLEAENDKPVAKISQPEKKPIDLRQEGIEKIIKNFTSEYLYEGAKYQESIREAIHHHGLEKVTKVYSSIGVKYLSLARERIDSPEKYTPEQIDKKYKEISDDFMNQIGIIMNHTPIDYTAREIRESYALWVKHKTEFYMRLLSSNVNTNNYNELLKKTFSEEEYRNLLKNEIGIIGEVYNHFVEFETGLKGLFATNDIRRDERFQVEFFKKKSWEYYPEAEPKK